MNFIRHETKEAIAEDPQEVMARKPIGRALQWDMPVPPAAMEIMAVNYIHDFEPVVEFASTVATSANVSVEQVQA